METVPSPMDLAIETGKRRIVDGLGEVVSEKIDEKSYFLRQEKRGKKRKESVIGFKSIGIISFLKRE